MTPLFERIRRITFASLVLYGTWCIWVPGPALIILEKQDFEYDFKHDPYFHSKETTLEQFKARRLKDRTTEIRRDEWAPILDAIDTRTSGQALVQLGRQVVFRSDQLPPSVSSLPDFHYLHPAGTDNYYSITRSYPSEIHKLPSRFKYPDRALGLALLISGFMVYFLLPKAKPRPGQLTYSRAASVTIPDLMGVTLSALFLSLSIGIISENQPGSTPLENDGWMPVTFVMWGMGAMFLSLLIISNRYATLSVEITPDALIVSKAGKEQRYPWHQMNSCQPYRGKTGRVLGLLLILFGRTPGQVGQGILVAGNEAHGVEIELEGLKPVRIMANHFPGFPTIIQALQQHQVKGASGILPRH